METITHTAVCAIKASLSDFDVIHFHSIGPAIMSWLPKLFGKKVVATSHGIDWQRAKWGKAAKAILKLGEWASSVFPDATTGVSLMIKDHYKSRYDKTIEYVPNGVTIPEKSGKTHFLAHNNIKPGQFFLFLSRIVPEKGLHYLIKAYNQLDTDYQLVIAGEPTHAEGYYEEILELANNKPDIIFVGAAYAEDKAQLFENAFCFILPSDIEGMPIVLLESLAHECFPIVSDIAVNKSIIVTPDGQFGRHFKHSDPNSLRNVMQGTLDNKQFVADTRKKLLQHTKDNYDWDSIATRYKELYESLFDRQ